MDLAEFEVQMRRDGYTEVAERTMEANLARDGHAHPFDAKGLVLDGELTLGVGGQTRTYRAGEVFAVPRNCEHTEACGPQGARYVSGRRA